MGVPHLADYQDSAAARHLWVFISISVSLCEHWVGILLSIWNYKKSLNTGTAFYINYRVIIPPPSAVNGAFHSDHLMDSLHSSRGGGMLQRRMSVWAEGGLPACEYLSHSAAHRDDWGS